jgi:hypothetical protein
MELSFDIRSQIAERGGARGTRAEGDRSPGVLKSMGAVEIGSAQRAQQENCED